MDINTFSVARMGTVGVKFYETTAAMHTEVEQGTQIVGNLFFVEETLSFYRKLETTTASLTDYTVISDLSNINHTFNGNKVFITEAENPPTADSDGDFWLNSDSLVLSYWDATASNWVQFQSSTLQDLAPFNGATDYPKDTLVIFEGQIYRKINDDLADPTSPNANTNDWVAISYDRFPGKWINGYNYLAHDLVTL